VKKKLFVIGKSKKPRCFKIVENLPVFYELNKRAWMTSELFEKFLRKWDNKLKEQRRKILLLVDNCPSHCKTPNLQKVKLVFLNPNVTSVLQPLYMIKSLKVAYRKGVVLKMIRNEEQEFKVSLLDAIFMLSKSWKNAVSEKTIKNCFRYAGFLSQAWMKLKILMKE
jgi:hypothetical protein